MKIMEKDLANDKACCPKRLSLFFMLIRSGEMVSRSEWLLINPFEVWTCADWWADGSSLAFLCRKWRVGGNQTLPVVGDPPTWPAPPEARRCDYSSLPWCVRRRWEGHRSLWCSDVGGALKHTGSCGQHIRLSCNPGVLQEEYWMWSSTPGSWQCIITWTCNTRLCAQSSGTSPLILISAAASEQLHIM